VDRQLSETHPDSGLDALVEDDTNSVWLYLRDSRRGGIVADCWLYNRREFAETQINDWPRDQPPPAPVELVEPNGNRDVAWASLNFIWSLDGLSVAVACDGMVLGYIAAGARRGHSRFLKASCPWGSPLDAAEYRRLFNAPAA